MAEETIPSIFVDNNVVLFWMPTGQFIIAKIKKNILDDNLHMSRARMIMPSGGQNGQVSFGMVPLGAPFFDDKDCERMPLFERNQYLMVKRADHQLADAYLSATSGIVKAPAGLLKGLGGRI